VRGILEETSHPPTLSRPRQYHRVYEYRPPIIFLTIELKTFFFKKVNMGTKRKDAKFYTDSKSEGKTEKKLMAKKLFSKNGFC